VRRILANRYVLAALLLLAVAAEFGVAWTAHPAALAAGAKAAQATRAAVTSVVRACPAPGSAGVMAGGVAMATASAGTGQAQITRLSAVSSPTPGAAVRVVATPGRVVQAAIAAAPVPRHGLSGTAATASQVATGPTRGGVMIQATGAMARGLEVEQTGPDAVASAQCGGPGTDFWFVGPGQHAVAGIELYLMNTDNEPATAEVDVYTDSGPLLGSTDTGIAVPAHGIIVQSLAKLVRNSRALALHISTSVGRVVAAVRESPSRAKPGAWLPAAQPPSTSLVLPGLPGSPGTRQLYVIVPGAANAQVKLTAVTPKGSYQPTGGTGIDLPGGSAVSVALPSLGGQPAAVRLTSNVPVTATMSVPGGAVGAPGAFTAASGPLQQQGVISGNAGGTVSLVLSAPRGAAQIRVATQNAGGTSAGTVVQVAAGHTVMTKVRRPAGSSRKTGFAVIVTPLPGSGPVYAGRVLTIGGAVRSILPVPSSLSWVPLPLVHNSLLTVLPSPAAQPPAVTGRQQ
jgi:hypothetical protein